MRREMTTTRTEHTPRREPELVGAVIRRVMADLRRQRVEQAIADFCRSSRRRAYQTPLAAGRGKNGRDRTRRPGVVRNG